MPFEERKGRASSSPWVHISEGSNPSFSHSQTQFIYLLPKYFLILKVISSLFFFFYLLMISPYVLVCSLFPPWLFDLDFSVWPLICLFYKGQENRINSVMWKEELKDHGIQENVDQQFNFRSSWGSIGFEKIIWVITKSWMQTGSPHSLLKIFRKNKHIIFCLFI